MKRILVCLLTFIPAVAVADKSFMTGKGATWDCKKDPVVSIMHGKGVYTFKGACTSINVAGGTNKLTIESVDELNLTGAKNTVTVGTVGTINLTGSKNNVTWKGAKSGDAPSINNVGKDNVVAQAGGAAPKTPPATTAPAPKPAAPATRDFTVDCSKSGSFTTADNDGSFTVTGTCDTISISGNHNKLKIESVKTLSISGNDNAADAGAAGTIATSGNDNRVSYKRSTATKTKVLNTGNGNKIATVK